MAKIDNISPKNENNKAQMQDFSNLAKGLKLGAISKIIEIEGNPTYLSHTNEGFEIYQCINGKWALKETLKKEDLANNVSY